MKKYSLLAISFLSLSANAWNGLENYTYDELMFAWGMNNQCGYYYAETDLVRSQMSFRHMDQAIFEMVIRGYTSIDNVDNLRSNVMKDKPGSSKCKEFTDSLLKVARDQFSY
ncbi:hypothetical protein [Vibrio atypicus]|uniref:hypothetical protein n=1 Tax=Vibrio atypicus TaxID=558271 RepID=UPI00135863ED|nr:hypothetical protein [Vibrio atypicus]